MREIKTMDEQLMEWGDELYRLYRKVEECGGKTALVFRTDGSVYCTFYLCQSPDESLRNPANIFRLYRPRTAMYWQQTVDNYWKARQRALWILGEAKKEEAVV